jgi:hypothetical protein
MGRLLYGRGSKKGSHTEGWRCSDDQWIDIGSCHLQKGGLEKFEILT